MSTQSTLFDTTGGGESNSSDSEDVADKDQCVETTRTGKRCKFPPLNPFNRCSHHVDLTTVSVAGTSGPGESFEPDAIRERQRLEARKHGRGSPLDPRPNAFSRRPDAPVWECQRDALLFGVGYLWGPGEKGTNADECGASTLNGGSCSFDADSCPHHDRPVASSEAVKPLFSDNDE